MKDSTNQHMVDGQSAQSSHARKFCISPFDFAFVDVSGNLSLCCQGYLPLSAGNLHDAGFEAVWNSPLAQEIRQTILDGSFKHCSKTCPYLKGDYEGKVFDRDALPSKEYEDIVANGTVVMDRGPRELMAAYDATCNLSCPACRTEHIVARGEVFEEAVAIHEQVVQQGLKDLRLLYLSGQGDPFSSRIYREFMENFQAEAYPGLRIALITNALLVTPKVWSKIKKSHSAISFMQVSCNAASAEAFAKVQRGGKWERFLENIQFISSLRAAGEIPYLRFSFYVSAWNYRDMVPFIELAEAYGADDVILALMDGSFIMSEAEYREIAVHLPTHPEHENFLKILEDPIFRSPFVSLGNLQPFVRQDGVGEMEPSAAGTLTFAPAHSFEAFAAALVCEGEQNERLLQWVRDIKRIFAEVMGAPSLDGGPPPLMLLAQSFQREGDVGETPDSAFEQRAKTALHEASGRYYFDTFNTAYHQSLSRLRNDFDTVQMNRLRSLDAGRILDIELSDDPFHRALTALLSPTKREELPENYQEIEALAGLDAEQRRLLSSQILLAREQFRDVCAMPSRETGESPLTHLATRIGSSDPAAHKQFLHALQTHHPVSTEAPYVALLHQKNRAIVTLLEQELGEARCSELQAAFGPSVFDWPHEVDPFGEALKACLKSLKEEKRLQAK